MMLLATMFGGSFQYLYTTIGLSVNISGNLLSWATSISAVLQAVTRLLFGYLYDKFGFKKLFYILMIINIVNSIICYHARNWTPVYFICILLVYMVFAGMFSIFPAPAAQTFGPKYGAQVYSIILVSGLFSSLIDTINNKVLYTLLHVEA